MLSLTRDTVVIIVAVVLGFECNVACSKTPFELYLTGIKFHGGSLTGIQG